MRISDWSSDVCSSDLIGIDPFGRLDPHLDALGRLRGQRVDHRAHAADAFDIGLGLGGVRYAVDIDQKRRHLALRAAHLVEQIIVVAKGEQAFLARRSEEHTSELQSLMRISYAVFCLKKKKK